MNLTRRNALKSGAGALALGSLAGCLDDVAGGQAEFDSAYAAFFALWDWSQAVAGEEATVENPVEYGQLGHGWEPDGDLPREVASTSAFVYLDTPEFSWAQDLAATLDRDYETVAAIDGLAGLESRMLESDHDHGHEDDHEGEDEHHDDEEHHDDHEGEDEHHDDEEYHDDHEGEDEHHDDEEHHDESDEEHHDESDEEHHEGEDEHHDEHEGEDEHDEETERGQLDPHVWVDPVLAQEVVDTIAARFTEIDPDNAETFEANAADYKERLAELDAQYQQLVAEADGSTAVLASHSSFAYVEDRYGFDIHTVTGISPDAEPDSSAISETIELVNEIGTDVILYDQFESDRLATTIVNNSDATEAVPITAGAGTTSEWADDGVDFVDQMEQVTLPAFRRALGAE